jgi:hypothetical protein
VAEKIVELENKVYENIANEEAIDVTAEFPSKNL